MEITALPAFSDNYIWLLHRSGSERCAVVDPGDGQVVRDYCEAHDLVLSDILITHHHSDHVGGVKALLDRYDAHVWGPANERIPCRETALKQGDEVSLDYLGVTLSVLDVPGHTAGHIAYFAESEVKPLLFCGDTLFAGGCGRLFEGTPEQMWNSLQSLAALPDDTQVYCAHEYTLDNLRFAATVEPNNGDLQTRIVAAKATRADGKPTVPTEIGLELATNLFMRADQPDVAQAAARRVARELDSATQIFAVIRHWKDNF